MIHFGPLEAPPTWKRAKGYLPRSTFQAGAVCDVMGGSPNLGGPSFESQIASDWEKEPEVVVCRRRLAVTMLL